jgi:glucose/mannose-6-phosphate isomerase
MTAFRDQVAGIPDQLETEPALTGSPLGGTGRLIVAGMGGSAVAGEFAAAAGDRETVVVRGGRLPFAPRAGDALLAVSYSGETAETLSVWEDAGNRGLPRGAVASGGALLAAAAGDGAAHCRVPGGFAPRTALGHLVRGACRLAGPGPDWAAVAAHLRRVAAVWEDADNPRVRALTDALESAVPALLVPEPELEPAANRWVADLAENAKAPSMIWALPEASHNRIMAVRSRLPLCCVAVGAPQRDGSRRWWTALAGALEAEGVAVHVVDEPAPDGWSYALGLAYVGDWVSFHLAERLGVDPIDISLMDAIKQRLRPAGGQGEE